MIDYMELAIAEARKGMRDNAGGPFGAVIVHNGQVIATGHNQVIKSKDPTAHAEVVAIRAAAAHLGRFDLSDCEIYSTCEPCPMCFAAIHWARLHKLHYGCTHEDAREIGFDDAYIYEVIRGQRADDRLAVHLANRESCLELFTEWVNKEDKTMY